MNSKALKIIVSLLLLFTILTSLISSKDVYAYADLTEFNEYIENLDISYKDLSLTTSELKAIEDLQKNGGITYGMYTEDNTVLMVFNQISKVFDIEVHQVEYDNFDQLISDVKEGKIDFTGSIYHTEERLQLFDFTTSTHRDKTFLFIKHELYQQVTSEVSKSTRVFKIGYPNGFALEGLLPDRFKENYDYVMVPLNSMDEAARLLESNQLDFVMGDITWYGALISVDGVLAIDYTNYMDSLFAGSVTRKGTNKELVSAIHKMYAETDALIDLQNQIDNYYEKAAIYALTNRYKDAAFHDMTNQIYISEFRPYAYEENGVATGLFVELLEKLKIFFDFNYDINFVKDINPESISESGVTIFAPIFITDENEEKYHLTIPVAESNMKIITIPDNTTKYFTRVSDLDVQKVGALDYGYMHDYTNQVFFNSENIFFYDNLDALVKAIEAGEVSFGIVSYEEFNKYALKKQITHVRVLSTIKLPQYGIAFGTPKTHIGSNTEAVISSAISIINYSELENKYLATNSEIEAVYQYRNEVLQSTLHMIVFTALFAISALSSLIYINRRRANTDYLTKLRNRRTLESYINATKTKKNISIAYIDLDNFKVINDVYGHHYGDKVLIYVASSLKKLSKNSKAFRIGGDEFIIVYNNKSIDFEKDIKKVLGVTISIEETDIRVEGSIGNLDLQKHSVTEVEDIINLVDYAMISAKRRGKNIIVDIDDELVDSFILIRDLRLALENANYEDNLRFYVKPIESDNNIEGFTLTTKCHQNGKDIDFSELQIHISNKQVLNKISLLVFEKLCMTINEMKNENSTKMLYIHDISHDKISEQNIETLASIMHKYNVNPRDIILRVDPSLLVGTKGQQYVNLLNTLGCYITVDFYKMTGESLFCLNQINLTLIELELFGLVEFLKIYSKAEMTVLTNNISDNIAVKKVIDLVEVLSTNLLLYTSSDMYEYFVAEHFANSLKTEVFTVERDSSILFEDFLKNIETH